MSYNITFESGKANVRIGQLLGEENGRDILFREIMEVEDMEANTLIRKMKQLFLEKCKLASNLQISTSSYQYSTRNFHTSLWCISDVGSDFYVWHAENNTFAPLSEAAKKWLEESFSV